MFVGDDIFLQSDGENLIVVPPESAETPDEDTAIVVDLAAGEGGGFSVAEPETFPVLTAPVARPGGDAETVSYDDLSGGTGVYVPGDSKQANMLAVDNSAEVNPDDETTNAAASLPGDGDFVLATDSARGDLHAFISDQANKNTKRKTQSVAFRFCTWLANSKNYTGEPRHIEPVQMDTYIGEFLLHIKKPDGGEYEPDSLTSYHRALVRYLRDVEYPYSILQYPRFETSKRVLEAKRKQLKSLGYGNKPNRAKPIDDVSVDKLWESGAMGMHNAVALQNMIWYQCTQQIGLRGSHESRQMRWDNFELKGITVADISVEEVIKWNE